MLKVKKFNHKNSIITYVERVEVTNEEIYKILLLFHPGEVIINTNGILKNSDLFDYLKKNNIYFINFSSNSDDEYGDTIIVSNVDDSFRNLLDKIIAEDVDYINISDKTESFSVDSYLYNGIHFDTVDLGVQSYALCFDFYENEITTTYRKGIYDVNVIKEKIGNILKVNRK